MTTKACVYEAGCLNAIVARGLCLPHYQRVRLAGKLGGYPKVGSRVPTIFIERATLVLYLERALMDRIEEIAAARARRGMTSFEGANLSAVCRELVAVGLEVGRVK
jgi:hypothetical protein